MPIYFVNYNGKENLYSDDNFVEYEIITRQSCEEFS